MPADFEYTLVGFPTRYSSWTARAATVLDYFQIPHKMEVYHLKETPYPTSRPVQPPYKGGLLPALVVHPRAPASPDFTIHDSLAILEFLAESHAELPLWLEDKQLRALARSAVAKMHSGFTALRNDFATNFLARYEGQVPVSEQAKGECEKMVKLWGDSRVATIERLKALGKDKEDEGFLFGKFGIADAFFWPVLWRFRTYNLPLTGITQQGLDWMEKMWRDPKLKAIAKDYFVQAEDPATKVDHYDDIFRGNPDVKYGLFTKDWEFERPDERELKRMQRASPILILSFSPERRRHR